MGSGRVSIREMDARQNLAQFFALDPARALYPRYPQGVGNRFSRENDSRPRMGEPPARENDSRPPQPFPTPGGRNIAAIVCLLGALITGCTPKSPVAQTPAPPTPAQRLTSADTLVRAGCLDCLIDAYGEYDLLRAFPYARDAATLGAIRAAGLIARRQRELGMVDDGYLERARTLAATVPNLPASVATLLDVLEVLPATGGGVTRTPTSDLDLDRQRRLRVNFDGWSSRLREAASTDELGAYLWLSFACSQTELRDLTIDQLFEPVAPLNETPLIALKRATCRRLDAERLTALVDANPRFKEIGYWLGLIELGDRKLDPADKRFEEAYAWRQQWPTLTQSMANVAMTAEEFQRSLTFYDRTLELEPNAVDALLGRVRALTYLGRQDDAIATTDRLIALRWFVGDARYWRALNESELERNDEAWVDVEAAAKLLINADVPKLAGLVAYRRKELTVARERFTLAHTRNANDCETTFYLGVVDAELRDWGPTADILIQAARCLQENENSYLKEIASIEGSDDPPARKAAKIARRRQYIAKGRRQMATSWFDTAVACYNLSRRTEAQQYAEMVAADEQFGDRAKEILSRLR
jgi:tetratricopeptide (TPR) repeat protein